MNQSLTDPATTEASTTHVHIGGVEFGLQHKQQQQQSLVLMFWLVQIQEKNGVLFLATGSACSATG